MPLRREALAEMRRRQLNGMFAVAVAMTSESKKLATRHVDNGTRRNSITQTKLSDKVLWGIPKNSAPHAVYLELGFRPHWVPARHIWLWMRRTGFQRRHPKAKGVFVGGPGSTLDYGGGGATAELFIGYKKRVRRTYRTRGRRSPYIKPGKVGHAILRPVANEQLRHIAPSAFLRGYQNG
jgi:hypothetical protein